MNWYENPQTFEIDVDGKKSTIAAFIDDEGIAYQMDGRYIGETTKWYTSPNTKELEAVMPQINHEFNKLEIFNQVYWFKDDVKEFRWKSDDTIEIVVNDDFDVSTFGTYMSDYFEGMNPFDHSIIFKVVNKASNEEMEYELPTEE